MMMALLQVFESWYRGSGSNRQGFVAFLPYVPVRLKALKPKPFPETPQTLGEHLKRCRLLRDLTLTQAAELLGVDPATVHHWEKNKTSPAMDLVPTVVRFLGIDPFPEPRSLPERLLAKRREMGWSAKRAARELGVDVGTLAGWESGKVIPRGQYRKLLERFLDKR